MKKKYVLTVFFSLCIIMESFGQTVQSVSFDGTDDYIEMANSSVHRFTPRLTIEAWIKPSSDGNVAYAAIANNIWHTTGQQGGYGLLMSGSTSVYFVVTVSGVGIQYLSGSIGSSGEWKHVAGTYDSTMMRLYVNGVQVESLAVAGAIDYTYTNNFRIGLYYDDGEGGDIYYYKGLIDEVRVWNVVRTQSELQQNDSTELSGSEPGLVGYWKLDEGSGTTTQDGTDNNIDGTLYGGAGWVGETGMPVELTSFTAVAKGRGVELAWQTATEVNNYGFEIERREKVEGRSEMWNKIGFAEGNGTTNSPKSYSFVDASANGCVAYRLKQIDRNGKFEYSHLIEITITNAPKEFSLMQNHPNPFNPTTKISYEVPSAGFVSLKVYNLLGKEVATLVNGVQEAGKKIAEFSAEDGCASGVYFYTLRIKNFSATKKMLLIK